MRFISRCWLVSSMVASMLLGGFSSPAVAQQQANAANPSPPILRTDSMSSFPAIAKMLEQNKLWVKPVTIDSQSKLMIVPLAEGQVMDICKQCLGPNPPKKCMLMLCTNKIDVQVHDIVVPKKSLCGSCTGQYCYCNKDKPDPLDPNFGLHKQILELQRTYADELRGKNELSLPDYRSVIDAYRGDAKTINQLRLQAR